MKLEHLNHWKQLRAQIARWNGNFDMGTWLRMDRYPETPIEALDPACGTAACLAGTAFLLERAETDPTAFLPPSWDHRTAETVQKTAKRWLGLRGRQARYVFSGAWHPRGLPSSQIPAEDALAYIDKVIKTGNVYSEL